MSDTEPGTELVPATESPFAVVRATADSSSDLATVLAENTGAGGLNEFDLDRVVMPSGGVTTWMVPGLEGEQPAQAIEGVIVAWREPRGWWSESLEKTGGGTPPDCSSNEGVDGHPNPIALASGLIEAHGVTGDCRTCPLAQFGSDPREDSNAQWCKQRRLLFVVREDDFLPLVVSLSPGSLKAISRYFLRLSSKATPYHGVVTRLGLTRAQSGGGIAYAQVDPSFVRKLSPEEHGAVQAYSASLRGAFEAITITQDEAEG